MAVSSPRSSVVVPTLGLSRWLLPCLEALRRSGGEEIEILLVLQGDAAREDGGLGEAHGLAEAHSFADRVFRSASNLGFAAANNLGLAAARGEYLATVNDDAIVVEGWHRCLLEALDRHPRAAAAQGINLKHDAPSTVDGAGVAWNRYWQAVQIGHGGPLSALPATETEIFGVSATAAIYRRSALEEISGAGRAFDDRLFAYYEDVDLACRLRAAGYQALLVPEARAAHVGSVSGVQLGGSRRWVTRNRHLVLARLLGRAYWPRLPWLILRDKLDLWQALLRGDIETAAAIAGGVFSALGRWHRFARWGRPMVALEELRRFRVDEPDV